MRRGMTFRLLRRAVGKSLNFRFLIVLMIIGGALGAWIRFAPGQGSAPSYSQAQRSQEPLIVGEIPATARHRFLFRNDSASPISIKKVEATCSCTSHSESTGEIAPGDEGYLSLTMAMYKSGPKSTEVKVDWSTGEQTIFTLQGEARATAELGTAAHRLRIQPGESIDVDVWLSTLSSDDPALSFEQVAAGYAIAADPWKTISEGAPDVGISRRLACQLHIRASPQVTEATNVIVQVSGAQPLTLTVSPAALVAPNG